MNIITLAVLEFIRRVYEIMYSRTAMDFGVRIQRLQDATNGMMNRILGVILEEQDKALSQNSQRRKDWEIIRMDKRVLVTAFGILSFSRRYYRHRLTGDTAHLLDRYSGIEAGAKVNSDVRRKAVRLAVETSYAKSAAAASAVPVSAMSVCTYVNHLERFPPLREQGERRAVKWLYVEADEDHVSLQHGGKTHVKLVYVHEGVRQTGKRHELINARYLTWPQEKQTDKLWQTVNDYIAQQYDTDALKGIFLSGDAGKWIRKGEDFLYPCIPVLDKFHTMKALKVLCGGRSPRVGQLLEYMRSNEPLKAKELCRIVVKEAPKSRRETKMKNANYLLHNWQRILNQRHEGAVGCSAEGHVSHILSARLSSRPGGWSMRNMQNIAQLCVMTANGELIDYQSLRKVNPDAETDSQPRPADALVYSPKVRKILEKHSQTCLKEHLRNLPILTTGKTSQLYQALHGLSLEFLAC